MKKSLALVTFFIGGSLLLFFLSLIGCGKRDQSFLFKDIKTQIIKNQADGFETSLPEGDTALYSNVFISSSFDLMMLSSAKSFFQGNKTYAFQPGDRYYKPAEKISDISITTLYRYNSNYPAGADITDACRFNIIGTLSDPKDSSASVAVESLNAGFSDIGSGIQPIIRIYLSEKPDMLSTQQFAITLKTEVDATIRDTTIHFYLKP
jgi:hypothetical protein